MKKLLLISICMIAAQSSLGAAAPTPVAIKDYRFTPAVVRISAGGTITWTNMDSDVHTVMSATGLFVSGALDTDDKFSYTFTKPGTYVIACSLHPQMSETIVVE
jgi:plastocyanin